MPTRLGGLAHCGQQPNRCYMEGDESWTRWILLCSTCLLGHSGETQGGCISGGAGKQCPGGGVVQLSEVQPGGDAAEGAQQHSTGADPSQVNQLINFYLKKG